MEIGAGTVDGCDTSGMCDRFALGDLAAVFLGKSVRMFVDACVTEVESSEAADVINDVFEKLKIEST